MATSRDALHFPDANREHLSAYLPGATARPVPGLPFVTLTFATSLDSALSLAPGTQTALSGPQSKAMTHYLRSRHDAILIGIGTAIADNPSLNCRLEGVGGYGGEGLTGQPQPVVIDPSGRWRADESAKVLQLARQGRGKAPWVVCAAEPTASAKADLEASGGEFVVLAKEQQSTAHANRLSWDAILRALATKGIRSVMIEGGGNVINGLLQPENTNLVNSVIVTIAPTWLGQGGVVVSPERPAHQDGPALPVARLSSVKWQQLGEDVVLCGCLKP